MIDIKNKMTINWSNTKIGIIGAGISGIAAAKLGKHMGADIFISDYYSISNFDMKPNPHVRKFFYLLGRNN